VGPLIESIYSETALKHSDGDCGAACRTFPIVNPPGLESAPNFRHLKWFMTNVMISLIVIARVMRAIQEGSESDLCA
jgi:hypothetical protein